MQQLPADIQGFLNGTVFIPAPGHHEMSFKGLAELQIFLSRGESSSSPITLARSALAFSHLRIRSEKLIGHVLMIRPGIPLPRCRPSSDGKRRRTLIGGYTLSVQLPVQDDLPSVIYPVRSGIGWVISSLGMVRMGICVTEPSTPSTMPARS